MTSKTKRLIVLKKINELRKINPDEEKITYYLNNKLNTNKPNQREEIIILLRLESKKFIKINHPRNIYNDGSLSTADRKIVDILLEADSLEIYIK